MKSIFILDDCSSALKKISGDSIDLIVTSPPYADARKKTYGGVAPDEYVEWFLPISGELLRVLKPTGSFVLNIKERCDKGERHVYVLELILALKKQGWRWTEEYVWHKTTSAPGKWKNRFRDAWERLLHFTKEKDFKMNQKAVMVEAGDWVEKRLANLSENDKKRHDSATKSGIGRNISAWTDRLKVYPDNVLYKAPVCHNSSHSAAFPLWLPEWFINLFTDEGDIVLDPFVGSGTTLKACKNLNRNGIGIEKDASLEPLLKKVTFEEQSLFDMDNNKDELPRSILSRDNSPEDNHSVKINDIAQYAFRKA